MIFTETGLAGAYIIEPERFTDERGFFARAFDQEAFAARGVCYSDPAFGIEWPLLVTVISDRDRDYGDFRI